MSQQNDADRLLGAMAHILNDIGTIMVAPIALPIVAAIHAYIAIDDELSGTASNRRRVAADAARDVARNLEAEAQARKDDEEARMCVERTMTAFNAFVAECPSAELHDKLVYLIRNLHKTYLRTEGPNGIKKLPDFAFNLIPAAGDAYKRAATCIDCGSLFESVGNQSCCRWLGARRFKNIWVRWNLFDGGRDRITTIHWLNTPLLRKRGALRGR